ncbi:MAG: cytochrome c family protein [Fidelibacterota bacterium]
MMKRSLYALVSLGVILSLLFVGHIMAQEKEEKAPPELRQYVGAKKCKPCHISVKKGKQYKIWKASKHAQSYEVLASDKAREVAKSLNVEDPQKSPQCLTCHVTGYGLKAEAYGPKYLKEDGITCEACHGAGGDYWKPKVMKQIWQGKLDPAEVGLIKPSEEVCMKCHDKERVPAAVYKEFKFEERVKSIAHPYPEELKKPVELK